MGTVKQIKEKYERARATVVDRVAEVVSNNSDVLLDLNRDQMLHGRDADGELLTPDYLSDPYFKTPESAMRYYHMKKSLEDVHAGRMRYTGVQLFPEKPPTTPNLIVTGSFQDGMFIQVSNESYSIGSTYADSNNINNKYKGRVFGLAPRSKEYFYYGWIRPAIIEHIKNTK